MRFPNDDFKARFNTTAGNGFGVKTSYGFHEGQDINGNGGGDTDLGEPILAIAPGKLVYYHSTSHPTQNFGFHNVYRIEGPWGVRWVHNSHLLDDLLVGEQDIQEGQQIGRVGKSGTTLAHNHFAIFKVDPAILPQGIDTIAKTEEELNAWWEDPIAFIEKWMEQDHADYYREYNLADRESMKVAVDKLWDIREGKLIDKEKCLDPEMLEQQIKLTKAAQDQSEEFKTQAEGYRIEVEKWKNDYEEEHAKNIDLHKANAEISKENLSDAEKAYDSEHEADELKNQIRKISDHAEVNYDPSNVRQTVERVIGRIIQFRKTDKQVTETPPATASVPKNPIAAKPSPSFSLIQTILSFFLAPSPKGGI